MGKAGNFIKEYARMLQQRAEHVPQKKAPFHAPVCVSREFGSGGRIIAAGIAERLHFKLVDREILEDIAARCHQAPNLVAIFDERPTSFLQYFGDSLVRGNSLHREEFEHFLRHAVSSMLQLGSVVILGRGAMFMAKPHRSFRLHIVADEDIRVRNIMEREQLTEKQAMQRLHNVDEERRLFRKRVFGHDTFKPTDFDLVVNTSTFTYDECVDMAITGYMKVCKLYSPSV